MRLFVDFVADEVMIRERYLDKFIRDQMRLHTIQRYHDALKPIRYHALQ